MGLDRGELIGYLDAHVAERGLAPGTRQDYVSALNSLIRACGGVDEALAVDEAGARAWLDSARLKGESKVVYLSKLRLFFSYLVREGVIRENRLEDVDVPDVRRAGNQLQRQRRRREERELAAAENAAMFTAFALLEEFNDSRRHGHYARLSYRSNLWKFADYAGGPDAVLFATAEDAEPWLGQVYSSDGSRVRAYYQMRAFFDYAVEQGVAPANPFREFRPPKVSIDGEWVDRVEASDLVRMVETAREQATTESGQLTYAVTCLVVFNGAGTTAMRDASVGDYRKTTRDGAFLVLGGTAIPLNAETERALDGYLSYRWGLEPGDPLFVRTVKPRTRFASGSALAVRVHNVACAAGVELRGRTLYSSLAIQALHSGLSTGRDGDSYGLLRRCNVVSAMEPEAELAAAIPPQSRVELGLLTRDDVKRGLAARADLAAALESDTGAELFDVVISYDGTVRFEPRRVDRGRGKPTPRILLDRGPR